MGSNGGAPRWRVLACAFAAAWATACIQPTATECDDGLVCAAGQVCLVGGGCADEAQVRACAGQPDGAACTLAGIGAGACRRGACVVTGCGDQVIDAGEQCDDGNQVDDDGCTNACLLPVCGDGVVQDTEGCDDGAANGDDRACTAACVPATCGDGLLQAGVETCDLGPGNSDGGACTLACRGNVCGDGKTWLGVEGCDDGNAIDDDACRFGCALPTCGDEVVQSGEACDDGAGNGDDRACTATCLHNVCGDGKLELGVEACDAGASNADDAACTATCQAAACGDGHVWAGVEACDDANQGSGDGCRADCRKVEACGDGLVDAGEACDDGAAGAANAADGCDGCRATAWQASAILGREVAATEVGLSGPVDVALDRAGNLFVVDRLAHRLRRVAAGTGAVTTVAGTGASGFSGDGGAASSAQLALPGGVAVDGAGNVYVADLGNHRIRKITAGTGIITTIAGIGTIGFSGDGGAATSAQLAGPSSVAVDGAGNVYVADRSNQRVRRIAAGTGIITTIAGTGVSGSSGDGGPATSARLSPARLAVDDGGDLFVTENHRIRRIAMASGVITTVAGIGTSGYTGDGGPATAAQLASPGGVAVDRAGNLFVADNWNHRVRRIDAATGVISTVAGTGVVGDAGDGGAATLAELAYPSGVAVDARGDVYVADVNNDRIRRIASATGVITTCAGTGASSFSGDGGAAMSAQLSYPSGLAVTGAGDLYVADRYNHRIRRVSAADGVITTVAGTGVSGDGGDGGPARDAQLATPLGVALDAEGNLYVADTGNHRIRRVQASTGLIATVAGTGVEGDAGDDGPATSAELSSPQGVAVDAAGNVYISDTGNQRIRRVDAATGVIRTIAGTGLGGDAGDGGPATSAELFDPIGVAVDGAGDVYVADSGNNRIRRLVAATGVLTTVAGTGADGFAGDGGAATSAELSGPFGVAVDPVGDVYAVDTGNHRVRRIAAATGIITTAAGTGANAFSGDGGPAANAALSRPYGVAIGEAGNVFVSDREGQRIRRLAAATGVITTVAGKIDPEGMGPAAQARLVTPQALTLAGADVLAAGGASRTVQALRSAAVLEVVAGRYPHSVATPNLARFRASTFGDVNGVAYDAALRRIYVAETPRHRIHAVTQVDPADEDGWTIRLLVGTLAAGFADGPAVTAQFDAPTGLFFDEATRVLYIADTGNHVVRAVPIDLAGNPGEVGTVAGTPRTLGYFGDGGAATDALLYGPRALTRCRNGDLFVADTSNQRVRRVEAGSGVITTVLGDGVAASSGQGAPASTFPVDAPLGLACDGFGNLLVASRTVVRLVVADSAGVVDGSGAVQTIYGAAPRSEYPSSVTSCLTGVLAIDAETALVADSCTGVLAELWRQPLP